jgi:hypothetical protein
MLDIDLACDAIILDAGRFKRGDGGRITMLRHRCCAGVAQLTFKVRESGLGAVASAKYSAGAGRNDHPACLSSAMR